MGSFDRALAQAQTLISAGQWPDAVGVLDSGLSLWRADAYSDVPGPFAESERRRLGELRLSAWEHRARALLALGGGAELVVELTELVDAHPLHESLRELLMLALHREGRQAEALEVFRDARRALVEAQGIEPGLALRELHRLILDGDAPRPPLGVVPPRVEDCIVGRDNEIAVLRAAVADVVAGRGSAVWVEGEPGIGKSALLSAALADARGCQLAWAVADELTRRTPLQVAMDCLGIDPPAPACLLAFVEQVCARGPLVMVIDDLQWADEASALLWHRLAAATRELPLLLVAAVRPEPGRRDLACLRRGVTAAGGVVLRLGPLGPGDTERLLGHVAGAAPGASLSAFAARTGGNPLYAKEIMRALVETGVVSVVDGRAEVTGAVSDQAPPSLLASVRRTLDFLAEGTREALRHAALIGVEFSVCDLAAVSGRSPVELVPALDEAVTANVVVEAGNRLAFRDPVLRQAFYDSIARPFRAALHRHAAEVLAGAGASPERVAEHLVAVPALVDTWVVAWLAGNCDTVCERMPMAANDLLRRVLDTGLPTPAQRAVLLNTAARRLPCPLR
ncbi:BREX system ATP-binding domain-containing protein [Allokutzneria albata]|uniref:BREX system ATP-binding domain-containing protein n=1 Tax=Allokutzneria albata TaxID=211114 RepID=UPI0014703488|nr:BREX system ATP-binding domain-containing protein [Allokutzneria albata]